VQRGELVLPPGMLKGILVRQEVHQMAACQALPLHHTMVVHSLPMVALASFLVLPSSATDLLH